MGRRTTQVAPDFALKTKAKSLSGLDQPEHHPGYGLREGSQTDHSRPENAVESMQWMVLHRPVELARLTGSHRLAQKKRKLTLHRRPFCLPVTFRQKLTARDSQSNFRLLLMKSPESAQTQLLVPQRDHRINSRGAPGGDVACE